jgi:hypothetical protein
MVYDDEYDPSQYEGETNSKGHGEAWERLNNHLFEEWRRFNARLEELSEKLEYFKKPPLTPSRRAEHVSNFRQLLLERYGTSAVDQRWEAERAKRLDARNQPASPYRKGNYAA